MKVIKYYDKKGHYYDKKGHCKCVNNLIFTGEKNNKHKNQKWRKSP